MTEYDVYEAMMNRREFEDFLDDLYYGKDGIWNVARNAIRNHKNKSFGKGDLVFGPWGALDADEPDIDPEIRLKAMIHISKSYSKLKEDKIKYLEKFGFRLRD